MDDAVMRYSDLIAPDNSIDSLIDLLGKVQSEYSELAQLAKKYAANMATDMRKVNTTTKTGRDELARLTAQADMAANAVKSIEAMYAGVSDELNSINSRTSLVIRSTAALIEQIQKYQRVAMGLRNIRELYEPSITFGVIDDSFLQSIKDVDSIMASISERANRIQQALIEVARTQEVLNFDAAGKAASDSLTSLRLALKDIIASYEDLEAMERGGQRGQATKNNLDTLRDAVTRLEAEIEPLVNKTLELIKAQQGLDLATSDEGKQIVELKQKIAELNKETALRITLEKELAGSKRAIEAELKLAQNELAKIPAGTPEAEALQAKVQDLATALAKMNAKTKPIKAELTALEQATQVLTRAQKALEVALTDEGKAAIAARQELAALNKETRLQNAEASSADGSYDQLKAQLQQAVISYRALSETERDTTAAGRVLADQITNLRAQLKALDDRTRAATASMSQDQLETMQAADVTEKLAKAKAKLAVTQSAEYEELIQTNAAQREANREAKLRVQLANSIEGSYNNMAAQYELNKIELKKLALANRELTEDEQKLVAETYTLRNEMKKFQEMTGVHTLSVGEYGKVWDSFGYSIQQIVREMPAAAMGINNLFIAVSNNIPIFIDELMKLRKENAAFIAQNQPGKVISIGKRIASSLFSWQTALMGLITVLTMFGDEIIKWIGDLFRANDALLSLKSAMKSISKEIKNTNDNYGTSTANFKELQQQYKELSSDAEKTKWIEKNTGALEELWLAIDDINDADRIFINEADNVIKAYKLRAQAAAAEKLAVEELEGALNKQVKIERKIGKYRDKIEKEKQKKVKAEELGLPTESFDIEIRAFEQEIARLGAEASRKVDQRISDAETFINLETEFRQQYSEILKEPDNKSGRDSEGRDLTDRIYKTHLDTQKKYRESETALIKYEYDRQAKAAEDKAATEIAALEETYRKTQDWIRDEEDDYKELTEEEKRLITESQENIRLAIENIRKKLNEDLEQIELDGRIAVFKVQEEGIQNQLALVKEGSSKELQLRQDLLDLELERALTENAKLESWQRQKEEDIIKKYEKQKTDLEREYAIKRLNFSVEVRELQLEAVKEGSEEEYKLRKELLEKQRKLEIEQNKLLAPELQQDETAINAKYNKQSTDLDNDWIIQQQEVVIEDIELRLQTVREGSAEELELQKELLDEQLKLELKQNELLADNLKKQEDDIKASYTRREKLLQGKYMLSAFQEGQSATRARYIADDKAGNTGMKSKQLNDYYLGIFDLEQEIALLEEQIWMAGQGFLEWSPEQIAEAEANVEKLNKDLDETKDIWNLIGEKGIGGGILTKLGYKDEQIDALSNATNIVIEQIGAVMDAEIEATEKAVELAQERVDAFQSAYDAEIEARNNGYANSVATAKKELELEKRKQRDKQKELEKAQRNQARLDSITQASSLVTASAEIWSAFGKMPVLAIAAIAAMWSSFAAAKIKARQVTSQEYGEGGLEFLEGGSHASGHDIDLGTTNSRGRRMRAEGGEAMAIINKRNTRKYKTMLPDIIDSLNAGNFEEKYLSSLNTSGLAISVNNATVDISRIEGDVADIKKQNETKYYIVDGHLIMQHKNVKRIIKN